LKRLGCFDNDNQRRRARARAPQDALDIVRVPRQLFGGGNGKHDLADMLLEVAFLVGRPRLHEDVISPYRGRRLVSELPLDRTAARDLDNQSRLLGHTASLSPAE
jgi:hypothetical protein